MHPDDETSVERLIEDLQNSIDRSFGARILPQTSRVDLAGEIVNPLGTHLDQFSNPVFLQPLQPLSLGTSIFSHPSVYGSTTPLFMTTQIIFEQDTKEFVLINGEERLSLTHMAKQVDNLTRQLVSLTDQLQLILPTLAGIAEVYKRQASRLRVEDDD